MQQKVELIKKLETGKGVQHLLDEAYKILGNPMVMFDTDYSLIAYTDISTDDRFWNEITTSGTFCFESQIFFAKECFTDIVANAEKLAIMKSDKLKYDRILGNIFNKDNIKVANILMLECNKKFEADIPVAFEALADLFSDEIHRDAYYISYGETYQDALIKRLIDRSLEDIKIYTPHVQILYSGFKSYLYLAVVDISRSKAQHNEPKYYVDSLRKERRVFKYAIYSEYIVMIMSTTYKTFNIKRDLNSLVAFLEEENLFVGISSSFENLYEVYKYYDEAVTALNNGQKNNGAQRIFLYKSKSRT